MGNNGIQRRIQQRVIDLVKKTGCWDQEDDLTDAVENMALFCIKNKSEVKKWIQTKKKK